MNTLEITAKLPTKLSHKRGAFVQILNSLGGVITPSKGKPSMFPVLSVRINLFFDQEI